MARLVDTSFSPPPTHNLFYARLAGTCLHDAPIPGILVRLGSERLDSERLDCGVCLSTVADFVVVVAIVTVTTTEPTSDPGTARTRDTDALVVGLPNSLVTIDLVRLNSGAGLVGVLTEILGIPGGITTDSTVR